MNRGNPDGVTPGVLADNVGELRVPQHHRTRAAGDFEWLVLAQLILGYRVV